jgi:hypothetical protein
MHSYDISHRPKLLARGDKVLFTVLTKDEIQYTVTRRYLESDCDHSNVDIFRYLGIADTNAEDNLCKKMYGYPHLGGGWPEYETDDYPAATRLVNGLFDMIIRLSLPPDMIKASANYPDGFIPKRAFAPVPDDDDPLAMGDG